MKRYSLNLLLTVILVLAVVNKGHAAILDPGAVGARATGMGSAMVGLADDLISAVYFNPAGLVQIKGTNMAMGSLIVNARLRYKSPQGYNDVNSYDGLIPFFAIATDAYKPLTVGLSMFSTLGVGFEFGADPDHGVSNEILSTAGVMFISPTAAYQITPRLALGCQLNIGYGKSKIDLPTPAGYLKTEADGFGFGTTIGLLYKINPCLKLGLSWRSPMKTGENGDAYIKGVKDDMNLDFYWPQMLSIGLGYKPTSDLSFGISLKWSDWGHFDHSKMEFKRFAFLNTPFSQDSRDGYRFQIGGEYRPNEYVALRAGYLYDRHSIDSKWIQPALFDVSFHEARIGLGIKYKKLQMDTSFNYTFTETRRVHESLVGYPGKYDGNAPIFAIEISYHF